MALTVLGSTGFPYVSEWNSNSFNNNKNKRNIWATKKYWELRQVCGCKDKAAELLSSRSQSKAEVLKLGSQAGTEAAWRGENTGFQATPYRDRPRFQKHWSIKPVIKRNTSRNPWIWSQDRSCGSRGVGRPTPTSRSWKNSWKRSELLIT